MPICKFFLQDIALARVHSQMNISLDTSSVQDIDCSKKIREKICSRITTTSAPQSSFIIVATIISKIIFSIWLIRISNQLMDR
jgi:hypothetical protein